MASRRSAAFHRTRAVRLAYRYPKLTVIGTQVNFWIAANVVLVLVSHTVVRAISITYGYHIEQLPMYINLSVAIVAGILYGIALGGIDLWLDRRLGDTSVGIRILLKGAAYSLAFALIAALAVWGMDLFIHEWFARAGLNMTPEARTAWALTFVPITVAGNFLISFIKQVNRSFGPGLLTALLLGGYRKPVTETRIFMFMDLRASTTHAETLGAERYSAMIRDLFNDADKVVPGFEAEIYQYVGDEAVFTWNAHELPDKRLPLLFFHAMRRAIGERAAYYQERYGVVPEFKAGCHVGEVIAVEVGNIKRNIAYHGDTINTAARIQAQCNDVGHDLLASDELVELCALDAASPLHARPMGKVLLKGKLTEVGIQAVSLRDDVRA